MEWFSVGLSSLAALVLGGAKVVSTQLVVSE